MADLNMAALTARQREVFQQICCGDDTGHPAETLAALERRGLIVGCPDELPGHPPVQITRWEIPLPIHIQWAAWCAEQPDSEEN